MLPKELQLFPMFSCSSATIWTKTYTCCQNNTVFINSGEIKTKRNGDDTFLKTLRWYSLGGTPIRFINACVAASSSSVVSWHSTFYRRVGNTMCSTLLACYMYIYNRGQDFNTICPDPITSKLISYWNIRWLCWRHIIWTIWVENRLSSKWECMDSIWETSEINILCYRGPWCFTSIFSEGASSYTDKTRLINSADSHLWKTLVIMKEQREGTLDSYCKL